MIVLEQLQRAGCLSCLRNLELRPNAVYFTCDRTLLEKLAADDRFARGALHLLHADIGPERVEFRSHTGALGKGSLQISVSQETWRGYADVDRFSPYSDLVGFVGHAGEVIGNWFKRA